MEHQRGVLWRSVWTDRDDDRADWNGMEACFSSEAEYEHFVDRVAEVICSGLRLSPEDVLADLGCGTGRLAARLAPQVRSVLAFDYSDTMLAIARRRRGLHNVSYRLADLNNFRLDGLGVTKAFSMGAFLYLDSERTALDLLDHLHHWHVESAILDIPDADIPDERPRRYDASVFTHLRMREQTIRDHFPDATIRRAEFGGYVNEASRFNVYLPSA